MADLVYSPLTEIADVQNWPLAGLLSDSLDKVWISCPWYDEATQTGHVGLLIDGELALQIPGIDFISLALGTATGATNLEITASFAPFSMDIRAPVTLRIDAEILRPIKQGSMTEPDPDAKTLNILIGSVDLSFDGSGPRIAFTGPIQIPRCMIGTSGVIIEGGAIAWLSPGDPAPAGATDPPPAGFTGIYLDDAIIHLPEIDFLPSTVRFDDAYIGTGGFSGRVSFPSQLTWDATQQQYTGGMAGDLFGFRFGLVNIEIAFRQGVLTKGSLLGEFYLPYLERRIGVDFRLSGNGDFTFGLSGPVSTNADPDVVFDKGLLHLTVPEVMEATLESISVERQGTDVALQLSGSIRPLLAGVEWPEVGVKALTIHSDGRVTIGGGWIDLPEQKGAGLFGFPLEIRRIGFGTEDGKPWVGFSGGIKLIEGLPIGGAVEGLKIKWEPNNPANFSIDLKGIAIDLEIPEVITLSGHVAMFKEGGKQWFQGGVTVTLHPLTCTLDAQLLVGRTDTYSFFYIFLEVALPVGIPLGCTSLALYGLGGLFGYNVRPDRKEGEPWYTGWYKRAPEGPTNSAKWTDEEHHLAFGATVTLGTLSDNGMAINARVLLILLIPGPVIMIDGRMNLMRDRKTLLTGDPLFKTLAVIDCASGTLLFDVEPHYLYPESGEDKGNVIDLTGVAEGFFDFNHPERWYVNVGIRDPKEKRIRATIIKLFKATSYLMLNNERVALGASVSIDLHYEYGPVGLRLGVWFDADAELVFRPLQLTAAVGLHGRAEIKCIGIGLSIEVDATAQVETPRPYTFSALLHAKADLPWPLPDFAVDIPYKYEEPRPSPLTIPLQAVNVVTLKGSEFWDTGAAANPKVVPLDGRPVIVFAKGMHDDAQVGGNIQPASSETSGDLTFDYRVAALRLEKNVGGVWTVLAARPQAAAPKPLYGMWLPMTNDETPCAKLMLHAKSPFDALHNASSVFAEQFVERHSGYPGVFTTTDYEAVAVGTVFNGTSAVTFDHDGLHYDSGGLTAWYGGVRVIDATTGTPISGKIARWPQRHALFIPSRIGFAIAGGTTTTTTTTTGGSGTPAPKRLRIGFPQAKVAQVRIQLTTLERVTLVAYDTAGTELDRIEVSEGNLSTFSVPRRVELTLTGSPIGSVDVDGGSTFIFAIQYLSLDITTSEGQINTHNQQEAQHWTEDDVLLDPDSTYRVVVETAVDVARGSPNSQWPEEVDAGDLGPDTLPAPAMVQGRARYAFSYASYFRTEGPPGFMGPEIDRQVAAQAPSLPPETGSAKAPASLVRTLRPYVDRTTPADGASRVYRSYDLLVHFNESYIKRFYASYGNRSLALSVTDGNGAPPRVASGGTSAAPVWTATQLSSTWMKARDLVLSRSGEQWANAVADAEWLALPLAGAPRDDVLSVAVQGPPLGPATAYVAVLRAEPNTGAIDAELHRFAFTTSRFSTFAHQVHSFDGRIWDSDQGRDTPLASLIGAQQTTLDTAANRGTAEDFETLRGLFQIGERQLPGSLEVTRVHDATRQWGFLIDSPEPIEGGRTRIRSYLRAQPIPGPLHTGPARIRDVRYGLRSTTNYGDEWIDILITSPTSLDGWRLDHLQAPGSTAFASVQTVALADPLYPGDIVRLHAGAAPPVLPDDRVRHIYAAASAANAGWILHPLGDTVRLVDSTGQVSSLLGALPSWDTVDCRWVWNADRTRAFVFPYHTAQGCLTALVAPLSPILRQLLGVATTTPMLGPSIGCYRFVLQSLLDASAIDASLPILSFRGRSDPEEGVVQVSAPA